MKTTHTHTHTVKYSNSSLGKLQSYSIWLSSQQKRYAAAGSQRTYNLVFSVRFKCSLFKSQVENLCVTKQFWTKKYNLNKFSQKHLVCIFFSCPKMFHNKFNFQWFAFFFLFFEFNSYWMNADETNFSNWFFPFYFSVSKIRWRRIRFSDIFVSSFEEWIKRKKNYIQRNLFILFFFFHKSNAHHLIWSDLHVFDGQKLTVANHLMKTICISVVMKYMFKQSWSTVFHYRLFIIRNERRKKKPSTSCLSARS